MRRIRSLVAFLAVLGSGIPASANILPSDVVVIADSGGKIMEAVNTPNVYLQKTACALYKKVFDNYQVIFVFTTIPLGFMSNVQQGWPVKQDQQGIGRLLTNQQNQFCATKGNLRQAVKMGYLGTLPADPDATYTGIPMYALSGIELMGHEFGHHWLASVKFDKNDGNGKHCMLRGYEPSGEAVAGDCDGYDPNGYNQHWSYYFGQGSVMYSNTIQDLGGGKFLLKNGNFKFGPLDLYLMGLKKPEDVPPLFVVTTAESGYGSASMPAPKGKEIELTGTRTDFTAMDVVFAEGPRKPAFDACHWKAALVLVHEEGKPPTAADLQKVADYGNRWESWYDWATDGLGSMDATIDGRGAGNALCPAPGGPIVVPDASPDAIQPRDDGAYDPGSAQEVAVLPDLWYSPDWQPTGADPVSAPEAAVSESTAEGGPVDECTPAQVVCIQDRVTVCNADGAGWTILEDCGRQGLSCAAGECVKRTSGGGSCNAVAAKGTTGPAGIALAVLAFGWAVRRRRVG